MRNTLRAGGGSAVVAALMLWANLARLASGAGPATTQAAFEILVDTSGAPEMQEFAAKSKAVAEEWYPKIFAMLPSDGFALPAKVTIVFKEDDNGVAATSGDRIVCSSKWFTDHPDDVGAIVHELVHVIQAYHHRVPGWITEGIADYVRFFHYEPKNHRPHPTSQRARYDASYRTSAAFLDWAQRTYDKDLVKELNAACRQGKYRVEFWQDHTGKSLPDLGEEWKKSLK